MVRHHVDARVSSALPEAHGSPAPVGRRKLYGRPDGVEDVFRPKRRVLRPRESEVHAQTGKRYMAGPSCDALIKHPERLHNEAAQNRSGYGSPETLAWSCKGRVTMNGAPAEHRVSLERTLEIECGIKKKTVGSLARRSGIPERAPGDKSYGVAACSPGFYKQEGLIPGACIDDRRKKDVIRTSASRPRHMSYEEKKRAEHLKSELLDVNELTRPREETEGTASWEERTGMYVWQTKAQRAAIAERERLASEPAVADAAEPSPRGGSATPSPRAG